MIRYSADVVLREGNAKMYALSLEALAQLEEAEDTAPSA